MNKSVSVPHWRKYLFWKHQRHFKANSVIVITGASSGIGRELALRYAQRSCKLILAARSKATLEQVAHKCTTSSSHCQAIAVVTDVTVEQDCKRLMEIAIEKFGTIDILVLNAGVGCHHQFGYSGVERGVESGVEGNAESVNQSTSRSGTSQVDVAVYRQLMDINYFGYLYCTAYAFRYLAESRGQIVVISSLSGEMGLPYRTGYCASKFAVTGFFESLRSELDLRSIPIQLTIVCPPSVNSKLRQHSLTPRGHSPLPSRPDKDAISAQECAEVILEAADRRLRKVYFPLNAYLGVYLRPFLPDLVDFFAKRRARL